MCLKSKTTNDIGFENEKKDTREFSFIKLVVYV